MTPFVPFEVGVIVSITEPRSGYLLSFEYETGYPLVVTNVWKNTEWVANNYNVLYGLNGCGKRWETIHLDLVSRPELDVPVEHRGLLVELVSSGVSTLDAIAAVTGVTS